MNENVKNANVETQEALNDALKHDEAAENMSGIVKLSALNDKQLDQAICVFVEGFFNVFKSVTKDKEKLHSLFKHSFDYDMTYTYILDGDAVAFLGLANFKKRPVKLCEETFMNMLSGFAGKMAYKSMSAAIEKINVKDPDEIYIDYIATSPEHRRIGIGRKLIEYVRDNMGYKSIKLDVFSKNTGAKEFYETLGFKTVKSKINLMLMLQGLGNPITMRMNLL